MGVILHVGAAAGGVDDDSVDVGVFEEVDGGAGEIEGGGFFSGVDAESAAAGLFGRGNDFAAFGGEDADGGGVDVREESALDAAEEKADASAFFALRGSDGGNFFDGLDGREKRVHGGHGFGEKVEEADGTENGLQAGFCVGEQGRAEEVESRGMGEGGEEEAAVEFFGGGSAGSCVRFGREWLRLVWRSRRRRGRRECRRRSRGRNPNGRRNFC